MAEVPQHERPPKERAVTSLFSDLTGELAALLHQELELAKTTVSIRMARIEADASAAAAAGAVTFAGCLTLVAAAVLAVNRFTGEPWMSALLVGLPLTALGWALLHRTRSHDRSLSATRREREEDHHDRQPRERRSAQSPEAGASAPADDRPQDARATKEPVRDEAAEPAARPESVRARGRRGGTRSGRQAA